MLNKHNLSLVGEFASTEESRYTLQSIHVRPTETIATNGHYMVRVSVPKVASEEADRAEGNLPEIAPFLLDAKQAREIGKSLGKDGLATVSNNEAEGAHNITNQSGTAFHAPKVNGQFPNVDAVMPKYEPVVTIGLSADYLSKIAKAFATFQGDKRARTIKLTIGDPSSPVKMEAENDAGQTMVAVLMPVRL